MGLISRASSGRIGPEEIQREIPARGGPAPTMDRDPTPKPGIEPPPSNTPTRGASPRKIDVPGPQVSDPSAPGPIVQPNVPENSGGSGKDKKAATRKDMESSGCGANCPPEENTAENEPPPAASTSPQTQMGAPASTSGFSLAGFSQPQLLILALVLVGLYANS